MTNEGMEVDFAAQMDSETEDNQPNEMSPSVMAPKETFGDRIIAASIWIDNAIKVMVQCPDYPKDDLDVTLHIDALKLSKSFLLRNLGKYPAASVVKEP